MSFCLKVYCPNSSLGYILHLQLQGYVYKYTHISIINKEKQTHYFRWSAWTNILGEAKCKVIRLKDPKNALSRFNL